VPELPDPKADPLVQVAPWAGGVAVAALALLTVVNVAF